MERITPPMIRGDVRQIRFTITNPDGTAWTDPGGTTITVTGKRDLRHADAAAVFVKSIGDGIVLVANVATVTLDPADTDTLAANGSATPVYVDVQVDDGAGAKTPKVYILDVEPDVTRTP